MTLILDSTELPKITKKSVKAIKVISDIISFKN